MNNLTKVMSNIPFGIKLLGGVSIGSLAVTAVIATVTEPLSIFGQPLSFAGLWFWASLAYIGASFRWTKPILADEIAVRTFFGNPKDILGPGLPFVPLGLFDLEYLPTIFNQYEFPAEPEKVFHGDLDERSSLPEGMKPPIRITFSDSIKAEEAEEFLGERDFEVLDLHRIHGVDWTTKTYAELDSMERNGNPTVKFEAKVPKDGLARRLTANAVLVVRWRVENGINFVQTIGDIDEANRQIEDEMVSVLARLLPKMSFAQAQQNIAWVNAHLYFAVLKRTVGWGARIDSAYVKQFNPPKRVNEAIANASKAEFQGRADKEEIVQRGAGIAKAARDLEEQTLLGRATGQKKLASDLGITGAEVQAAEVAREIAKGGNAVVIGQEGFAQLAGILSAMNKGKSPPNPEA